MLPVRHTLKPIPAVTSLLDLFATRPLIALGELHGLQEEADFIAAILHHPAFPATVQVIVVEFGNSRYQSIIDRFITGEPIATRDLRLVWRDIFGWGFDAPIYEQFFRTMRAINRTQPPTQRLRVLLGDPPIDWSQITQAVDIDIMMEQRDVHYASLVETHILAPGCKGLLIAGLAHFVREWPVPYPPMCPISCSDSNANTSAVCMSSFPILALAPKPVPWSLSWRIGRSRHTSSYTRSRWVNLTRHSISAISRLRLSV